MKKLKFFIPIIVIFLLAGLYLIYKDHLPPRSPYKIARIVSQLKIPNSSELIHFEESWNSFQGDGFSYIELSISESTCQKLVEDIAEKKYLQLPIKESDRASITDSNLYTFLKKFPETGFYRLEQPNSSRFDLIVLDTSSKRICIYISVM